MELPSWLKIENIIGTLNFKNWFKGWFRKENKTHIGDTYTVNQIILGDGGMPKLIQTENIPLFQAPAIDTDFIKKGLTALSLQKDVIDYLGERFKTIFEKNNSSRNGSSMLNGAMYALGSRGLDPEWREHCAGSLRELIHECSGDSKICNWFCNAFKEKNNDFPDTSTHRIFYAQINDFYDYFSEIHHHNSLHIIQRLQSLYGSQIKVGDDTPEMFVRVVKDFIEKLNTFFNEHVKTV
jgi:hypothetical protein